MYGIPLWGTASTSNIETLQGFQNKSSDKLSTLHVMYRTLFYTPINYQRSTVCTEHYSTHRSTVNAPRYVPNTILHTDQLSTLHGMYRKLFYTPINCQCSILCTEHYSTHRSTVNTARYVPNTIIHTD